MIITKEMSNERIPQEMVPTRLDSALNLYTNVKHKDESGILVYNTNPETWNCLYPFYEINHKFTVDDYVFGKESPTYGDLIDEYMDVYRRVYEQKRGFTKKVRIDTLISEFKKTFNLSSVSVKDEMEPLFELKYSKSKNVWTLYYFENYVANEIEELNTLLKQNLYEQKILPLDYSIGEIDGIEVVGNIPYLLSIKSNVRRLENNLISIND